MRLTCALLLILLAPSASAGAWLQEHGQGFLSFSGTYDELGRTDGTAYIEYGLRPKLTLGAKVDGNMVQGRLGDGAAFVFARKPIPTGERSFKLAYELGIGATFGAETQELVRTALSYGRGLTFGKRYGWLALDAIAELPLSDGTDTYKIDSTLGLTLNDRFKVMMQVFVSHSGGETATTLAPALIWQPQKDGASFVFGVEGEDGILALKLGLWSTF